ncbi:MotA/TolQ/ExbB proton channel family protein [Paraburkholderia phenoliruptrix]|uniref:Biopolymer transport protein ExbB n=2 Tax=Paraburkholderia phenoliruptrix TaxID=252970 RepID=K0DTM3_9BURK|nr:MotA/TolQ/ExbB proton channel family protein [Paraburkholderia phenoliruptrix]AFT88032.1 biopolymer transport protein ExbB [Paraburkholderia phenoliruptrix BR3459a]MDR6418273.1 biopolymer transport protein ExbB [Paraburkholderia phenoliruptrix]CAB4046942.1 Tol-Pal system protein TolQ [Paraburkholderia phenoliruptrix]
MQHYGLANVWQSGDLVTRAILCLLFVMSMLSWTVIVVKLWNVLRIKRLTGRTDAQFWQADSFEHGLQNLGGLSSGSGHANHGGRGGRSDEASAAALRDNPLLALAMAAAEAAAHHRDNKPHLQDRIDVSDWIARRLQSSIDDAVAHMQSGLAVLASIGSTAPFVGLFGTVWGIYHALIVIGETGQASIDRVAGPVGESLIMTAFGLFVAIPAVLGYNGLTRANKSIVTRLKRFAHGLHAYFVTGLQLPHA